MKKHTKTLIWICIVLACVSLIWLGYNTFMLLEIPQTFVKPDIYIKLIIIGFLVFFFSHMIIILSTILNLKNSQSMSVAGIILLILGVISFISLLFHWVSLNEIEDDIAGGYPYQSMLNLAWTTQSILISFFLFTLIYFIAMNKFGDKHAATKSVFREKIFIALNLTGVVCGIVGLTLVFLYFLSFRMDINSRHYLRTFDIIPYCFVLLPYLLVLIVWTISCLKDRRTGWYDEKQNADINRSGMIALLSSIPLIIVLIGFGFLKTTAEKQIYVSGTITVLWLVFYFFLVMLIFSGTALYSFKNN